MEKKVHIGEWEVCCNDMAFMIINDSIEATDVNAEPFFLYFNVSGSPSINYCPYCGVKIPRIGQNIE